MAANKVPVGQPLFWILGIPVHVSIWHLLTLLFFFQRSFEQGVAFGLTMLFAASASVFLHEMGHALTSRHFGLQPSVVLTGFGGFTAHQPAKRPRDEFLVIAAGPAMNFLLAATLFGVATAMASEGGDAGIARPLLSEVIFLNIFWGIYNLLPIMPLDGGQILRVTLRRFVKKSLNADRWTHRVGLVLGALMAVFFAVQFHSVFGAVLLGLAAFENYRALKSVNDMDADFRADRPHPAVGELLRQARTAFEARDFESAMRFCHQARAEPELSPAEIQHTWHILAISAASLGDLDDAIRFAERVPNSADMAQVQASCLLSLADAARIRVFLRSPAALLLAPERLEELKALVRGADA